MSLHPQLLRHAAARRAFTAMELVMALAISGLILICILGVVGASSSAWKHQESSSLGVTSGARTQFYLERTLRGAQDIGYWASGESPNPASLLLWAHDTHAAGLISQYDHQKQLAELVLIRHDPVSKKLNVFRPIAWTEMSSAEQADASQTLAGADFNSKTAADAFAQKSWVQAYAIAGAASDESVTSAWMNVDRSSNNPIASFRFDVSRSGRSHLVMGTVSVRTASSRDNWTKQVLKKAATLLEPDIELELEPAGDSGSGDPIEFTLELIEQ